MLYLLKIQISIKNLKLQNYYKYHDINLAREETLTQIKKDAIFNDNLILDKTRKKKS